MVKNISLLIACLYLPFAVYETLINLDPGIAVIVQRRIHFLVRSLTINLQVELLFALQMRKAQ